MLLHVHGDQISWWYSNDKNLGVLGQVLQVVGVPDVIGQQHWEWRLMTQVP